jgi:DNA-binding IclR family transcriptional regulator
LRLLLATRLPELCQPILDRLAHETRELVRLTLVQDARLVWIAAAQGAPPGLMYQPAMHGDVVLHTTANGKAWLATLPPTEAMRILKARGLAAVGSSGPRALRSYEAIADDLQRTRLRGWGLAEEEAESGVAAIARAIRPRAPSGAAVGTVSVAGPIVRVTPERYARDDRGSAGIVREGASRAGGASRGSRIANSGDSARTPRRGRANHTG